MTLMNADGKRFLSAFIRVNSGSKFPAHVRTGETPVPLLQVWRESEQIITLRAWLWNYHL